MATKKASSVSIRTRVGKAKVRRKGVHAKTKSSKNKGSKNYVKLSRGQG